MKHLAIILLLCTPVKAALPDTISDVGTREAAEYLDAKISSFQAVISTAYPSYFPRAIVNFKGSDASIYYELNVASVTRVSPGIFNICMEIPAPTINYVWLGSIGKAAATDSSARTVQENTAYTRTSTCFSVWYEDTNSATESKSDPVYGMIAVFY